MLTTTMQRIVSDLRFSDKNLSATMLALVSDIPVANLTAAMRDRIYLGTDKEKHIYDTMRRCLDVLDAIAPLTIPKGEWTILRDLAASPMTAEEIRDLINKILSK